MLCRFFKRLSPRSMCPLIGQVIWWCDWDLMLGSSGTCLLVLTSGQPSGKHWGCSGRKLPAGGFEAHILVCNDLSKFDCSFIYVYHPVATIWPITCTSDVTTAAEGSPVAPVGFPLIEQQLVSATGVCPTAAMPGMPWVWPKDVRASCEKLWSRWAKVTWHSPLWAQRDTMALVCTSSDVHGKWNNLFRTKRELEFRKWRFPDLNSMHVWFHFYFSRLASWTRKSRHLEQHGNDLCIWAGQCQGCQGTAGTKDHGIT